MKTQDFKKQFKVVEGLVLENSFGVVKSEDDVVINVSVGYRAKDDRGWFEIYDEKTGGEDWYSEGGLWFDGKELTDYDGCFSLPSFVMDCLEKQGLDCSFMRDNLA